MGISCNVIKPKEVAKLHPLVNIHDLVGALHLPGDAVVSPPDVNHALAVAAASHGEGGSDHTLRKPWDWLQIPMRTHIYKYITEPPSL